MKEENKLELQYLASEIEFLLRHPITKDSKYVFTERIFNNSTPDKKVFVKVPRDTEPSNIITNLALFLSYLDTENLLTEEYFQKLVDKRIEEGWLDSFEWKTIILELKSDHPRDEIIVNMTAYSYDISNNPDVIFTSTIDPILKVESRVNENEIGLDSTIFHKDDLEVRGDICLQPLLVDYKFDPHEASKVDYKKIFERDVKKVQVPLRRFSSTADCNVFRSAT